MNKVYKIHAEMNIPQFLEPLFTARTQWISYTNSICKIQNGIIHLSAHWKNNENHFFTTSLEQMLDFCFFLHSVLSKLQLEYCYCHFAKKKIQFQWTHRMWIPAVWILSTLGFLLTSTIVFPLVWMYRAPFRIISF